jgi:rRNA-processing protein FCF1
VFDPTDFPSEVSSGGSSTQNANLAAGSQASPKAWSTFAVDANFFILAFAQKPDEIARFKRIADKVSFKLCTSPQVLNELRWNLRQHVQRAVEVVNVTQEELDAYVQKAKGVMERIPQVPDLSLLVVLRKLREQQLVSSDFYLLESLRSLEPGIEGLMGSAFLLDMFERTPEDDEDGVFLERVRERVLHTEIKYSLARSSVYDPTTRIKLIETQAFHIVRSLRGPRIDEEDLVGMSAQEALGLRTFLQELRRRYSSLFHEIHMQNYASVLTEIAAARDELYNHLVILAWELAASAHSKLIRQITPDMVLLNYLAALCHLYLADRRNLLKARQAIEECNRILLMARPDARSYRRLMVMTHLLRITINIIVEDFDAATMYFTLFSRKCKDWGFVSEQATVQALYLALLVIRGGITSTDFPQVTDPEEVMRYLVDLAALYFMLRRFREAWSLLQQVLYMVQYFQLFDTLEPTLRRMMLIYYAEGCERKEEFTKLVTPLCSWLEAHGKSINAVESLLAELAGRAKPPPNYFTAVSLPAEQLHANLRDWMTVIDRVDTVLRTGSILLCRSWRIPWNVALLIQGVLREEKAKDGEQIRLGEGKFKVTRPPRVLKQRYRICALIHADPVGKSRVYVRGGQGFRLLQLGPVIDENP